MTAPSLADLDALPSAIVGNIIEGDETEAPIAPFDAVPLHGASWWPPAPPASSR